MEAGDRFVDSCDAPASTEHVRGPAEPLGFACARPAL